MNIAEYIFYIIIIIIIIFLTTFGTIVFLIEDHQVKKDAKRIEKERKVLFKNKSEK